MYNRPISLFPLRNPLWNSIRVHLVIVSRRTSSNVLFTFLIRLETIVLFSPLRYLCGVIRYPWRVSIVSATLNSFWPGNAEGAAKQCI